MIKDLSGDKDKLTGWMAAVDHDLPALRSFTVGLRRDLEAVTAGLTLQYNSGAVEGTVNKIKARKMQLFGRANHDLLRKLILLPERRKHQYLSTPPRLTPRQDAPRSLTAAAAPTATTTETASTHPGPRLRPRNVQPPGRTATTSQHHET